MCRFYPLLVLPLLAGTVHADITNLQVSATPWAESFALLSRTGSDARTIFGRPCVFDLKHYGTAGGIDLAYGLRWLLSEPLSDALSRLREAAEFSIAVEFENGTPGRHVTLPPSPGGGPLVSSGLLTVLLWSSLRSLHRIDWKSPVAWSQFTDFDHISCVTASVVPSAAPMGTVRVQSTLAPHPEGRVLSREDSDARLTASRFDISPACPRAPPTPR